MPTVKAIFNEAEAQEVLAMANEKIARIFMIEPKPVRFIFLNHIAYRRGDKECLGICNHEDNEIQIKVWPGWQNTAIHELAHLYNPDGSERKTEKVAHDIIRYLKGAIPC